MLKTTLLLSSILLSSVALADDGTPYPPVEPPASASSERPGELPDNRLGKNKKVEKTTKKKTVETVNSNTMQDDDAQ